MYWGGNAMAYQRGGPACLGRKLLVHKHVRLRGHNGRVNKAQHEKGAHKRPNSKGADIREFLLHGGRELRKKEEEKK